MHFAGYLCHRDTAVEIVAVLYPSFHSLLHPFHVVFIDSWCVVGIVVNSCFSCILLCGHHLNDIASLHIILETEYEIIDASNAEYSEKGEQLITK